MLIFEVFVNKLDAAWYLLELEYKYEVRLALIKNKHYGVVKSSIEYTHKFIKWEHDSSSLK